LGDSLRLCHATADKARSQSASRPWPLEEDEDDIRLLLLVFKGTSPGEPKEAMTSGSTKPSKAKTGQPCSFPSSSNDEGIVGVCAITANFLLNLSNRAACVAAYVDFSNSSLFARLNVRLVFERVDLAIIADLGFWQKLGGMGYVIW